MSKSHFWEQMAWASERNWRRSVYWEFSLKRVWQKGSICLSCCAQTTPTWGNRKGTPTMICSISSRPNRGLVTNSILSCVFSDIPVHKHGMMLIACFKRFIYRCLSPRIQIAWFHKCKSSPTHVLHFCVPCGGFRFSSSQTSRLLIHILGETRTTPKVLMPCAPTNLLDAAGLMCSGHFKTFLFFLIYIRKR